MFKIINTYIMYCVVRQTSQDVSNCCDKYIQRLLLYHEKYFLSYLHKKLDYRKHEHVIM